MADPKVRDWPENERPRERLLRYGADSLSDAQLLAIILRTGNGEKGVMSLSMELLDHFRGLRDIDSSSITELASFKGLGAAKIAQLKAAFALGKRLMSESVDRNGSFSSSRTVNAFVSPRLRDLKREVFVALLLDAKNRLIREIKVSEGTLTNSLIHPREAFKEAIRESAASIIFVHNHPSGDPEPSRDDIAVTERLKATGAIIGINVLDHIIIGEGKYVSLKERGIV